MPSFNENFLKITTSKRDIQNFLSTVYSEAPLYFSYDLDTVTEQLKEFTAASSFVTFQNQFYQLTNRLEQWCQDHQILLPVKINSVPALLTTAFQLFYQRAFVEDFYSNRVYLIFSKTKKELEYILEALNNDDISVDVKKTSMSELQREILVCADGSLSKIKSIRQELESYCSSSALILRLKSLIIRQLITSQIKIDIHDVGSEIHYANAYHNYLATDWGLIPEEDNFVSSLTIDLNKLEKVKAYVLKMLTPRLVIEALSDRVTDSIKLSFESINKQVNTLNPPIWADMRLILDKELRIINNQFRCVTQFDYALFINSEDFTRYSYEQREGYVTLKVNRGFNKHYLNEMEVRSCTLSSNICLVLENNVLSIVKDEEEAPITLIDVIPYLPKQTLDEENISTFLAIINQSLSEGYLDRKRIQPIISYCVTHGLIMLFSQKYLHILEHALLLNLITPEHITILVANSSLQFTSLIEWLYENNCKSSISWVEKGLLSNQQLEILDKIFYAQDNLGFLAEELLNNNCQALITYLTKNACFDSFSDRNLRFNIILAEKTNNIAYINNLQLTDKAYNSLKDESLLGVNRLWIFILEGRFELIQQLLENNVITPELLAAAPIEGSLKNISCLLLLMLKKFALFRQLVHKNLITSDLLSSIAAVGHNIRGKNIVFLLIEEKKFDLLKQLIAKGLVTTEHLSNLPTGEFSLKITCLWLLIAERQYDCIIPLIDQKIITSNHLSAAVQQGIHQGKNSLWMLIEEQLYNCIERLIDENLITSEHLSATAQQGTEQGKNNVWLLIEQQQYGCIKRLINKKLITSDHLSATAQQGIEQGKNVLWMLVEGQQYECINQLLNQNLITSDHLSATAQQGVEQGKNVLGRLIADQQYSFIKQLINKKLIISNHLSSIPSHGVNPGANCLWRLINQEYYACVEQLINQGRVTAEHLSSAPILGVDKDVNCLWKLIAKGQYNCIKQLLNYNLITSKHLSYAPTQGLYQGANCINMLINHRRFRIISELIDRNLITTEHLSSASTQGVNQGINCLLNLIIQGQYYCIEQLMDKQLITLDHLSTRPTQGVYQGTNSILALIVQKRYDLIEKLMENSLITVDNLLVYAKEPGNVERKSCVVRLIENKQFRLVQRLLARNLIIRLHFPSEKMELRESITYFLILIKEKQNSLMQQLNDRQLIHAKPCWQLSTADALNYFSTSDNAAKSLESLEKNNQLVLPSTLEPQEELDLDVRQNSVSLANSFNSLFQLGKRSGPSDRDCSENKRYKHQ